MYLEIREHLNEESNLAADAVVGAKHATPVS